MDQIRYHSFNNKVVDGVKGWFANAPLFTIFLLLTCLVLFIFSIPFRMSWILGNMPSGTLGKLQLYRLITFPFVNPTVIGFLFIGILYFPTLTNLERQWGTIKTTLYFFFKNFEIGLCYCIVAALISNFYDDISRWPSYTLGPIFLSYITQQSIKNPEELHHFLWLPGVFIKNKYAPFLFAFLYVILAAPTWFPLDALIAIGLGFAADFTDPYYFQFLTESKINEYEQSTRLSRIRAHPRFITGSQSLQTNLINNDSIRDGPITFTPSLYEPGTQITDTHNGNIILEAHEPQRIAYAPQIPPPVATGYPSLLQDNEEDLEKK